MIRLRMEIVQLGDCALSNKIVAKDVCWLNLTRIFYDSLSKCENTQIFVFSFEFKIKLFLEENFRGQLYPLTQLSKSLSQRQIAISSNAIIPYFSLQ